MNPPPGNTSTDGAGTDMTAGETDQQSGGNEQTRPAFDPSGNMGNAGIRTGTDWVAFGILAAALLAAIVLAAKLPGREH